MGTGYGVLLIVLLGPIIKNIEVGVRQTGNDGGFAITAKVAVM